MVGEDALVTSVETNGNWSYFAPNNRTHLYETKMNMSAAELFCVDQGGHLVSVGSQEEQDDLVNVVEQVLPFDDVWLGGRRTLGGDAWEWLDGRPWSYQKWDEGEEGGEDCMTLHLHMVVTFVQ